MVGVTVSGVREGEEVITVITNPMVLMNQTHDAAPFNPSNNNFYCYPLVLFTLRYFVGMIYSNAGTLGEIVIEHVHTVTHRTFYEKEQKLNSGFSFSDILVQFLRCAYTRQCM